MIRLFIAHITLTPSQSQLPVFGAPTTALAATLATAIILAVFYFWLDRLSRPRKTQLSMARELWLTKTTIIFVLLAMLSAGWDIWWHRAIGRETFWEAPHMFLYSFAILGILTSVYVWRHCREHIWKRIAFVLTLIPLSAPLDNFWHSVYGVEDLTRPVSLSWAPGHAMLNLAAMAALILLLKVLLKHRKTSDFLIYANFCLAAILGLAMFLVMPFNPTEGWGAVWGFWGAGVLAFVLVVMILVNEGLIDDEIGIILMLVFSMLLMFNSYTKEVASQVTLLPHDRPPIWLMIFAYLGSTILFALSKKYAGMWARGALAGMVWTAILFGFSWRFFAPEFQYGLDQIIIAIFSGAIGGLLASLVVSYFTKQKITEIKGESN